MSKNIKRIVIAVGAVVFVQSLIASLCSAPSAAMTKRPSSSLTW